MAIRITEDGVVNYENSPDVNRKLFPNLNICGEEIDKLEEEINGKAPTVFSTTSGSIASFDNGADDMPLKSCVVTIEPIQEGEGDPSPENVRPIGGRTGLTVSHSGADTSDPATISVNWETEAGTVYGGSLDVVSGKLTVDRASYAVSGNENISYNSTYGYFNVLTPLSNCIESVRGGRAGICSHYPVSNEITTNTMYANYDALVTYANLIVTSTLGRWQIRDSRFTTVEEFKTYLSGQASGNNPVRLIYLIATPTEFQLTPQEVRTLLGENNIWSDAGDVSVDYPADTKTYVDDLSIKTVEVTGQTPTITAEENTRYICGEVTSLSFTPCEKGICDVRFTAASISTVLTLPETVKLPEWFDPTLLEAGTTYEINIVDGVYGAVMSWA